MCFRSNARQVPNDAARNLMNSTYGTLAARAPTPQRSADSSRFSFGAVVWRFIDALSQRKAAAEILELANSLQSTRPETAAQMRRAARRSGD
jgi:hypothetical protein